MKKTIYLLTITLLTLACGKNSDLVVREETNNVSELEAMETHLNIPTWGLLSYSRKLPGYLRDLGMQAPEFSKVKATLGRVLFYDKNLSRDRSVSCASCHKQEKAFSDDVAFSTGIESRKTSRNSLPLGNVANFAAHYRNMNGLTPLLFWDARANSVPAQSRQTLANSNEMGMEMTDVVARVAQQPYYSYLWKQAYGSFEVTEERVLECLSEFVGAMGSYDSKLDKALEKASGDLNKNGGDTTVTITNLYYNGHDTTITITLTLSESEDRGRAIFVENCTKCHSPIRPFQEVFEACNGLEMQYADQGIGAITGNPADNGVFKSPSLRNIALTAPYMHDGRFQTLEEVVEFYNKDVKNHPNLHPELKRNGSTQLHLTPQQKQDLVAFLHTLTDNSITTDERFSNPFK